MGYDFVENTAASAAGSRLLAALDESTRKSSTNEIGLYTRSRDVIPAIPRRIRLFRQSHYILCGNGAVFGWPNALVTG